METASYIFRKDGLMMICYVDDLLIILKYMLQVTNIKQNLDKSFAII